MEKREKSAVDSKNRIKKLGVYCVQNDISEKEIERETRIKRFGKEEIIDYVLDHAMNLKQCEEVYKKHKIFQKEVKNVKIKKKDVVTIVREKTGFKRKEISEIIDETLNSIVENAKRYDEVNLPPLGKFMVKKTKDRNGINPNTKEQVVIKGRNVVKFKPTTTFKEEVKE